MLELVTKADKVFKTIITWFSMLKASTMASLRVVLLTVRTLGSTFAGVVEPHQKREIPSIFLKSFVGIY